MPIIIDDDRGLNLKPFYLSINYNNIEQTHNNLLDKSKYYMKILILFVQ